MSSGRWRRSAPTPTVAPGLHSEPRIAIVKCGLPLLAKLFAVTGESSHELQSEERQHDSRTAGRSADRVCRGVARRVASPNHVSHRSQADDVYQRGLLRGWPFGDLLTDLKGQISWGRSLSNPGVVFRPTRVKYRL